MVRSPSTSCATFKTRVESTPPEKATAQDGKRAIASRSLSSFDASGSIDFYLPSHSGRGAGGEGANRSGDSRSKERFSALANSLTQPSPIRRGLSHFNQ